MERLLSAAEAAERLGVTPSSINYWAREGRFPNAQWVGKGRFLVIPENDLLDVSRCSSGPKRRYLTPPEYEGYGLDVMAYWKRKPPILRCQTCGRQWRGWDWQCANGCNADAERPRRRIANPELREARERAGLTQAEVARAVGVSTAAVSQWEMRGTQPRDPETRQRLSDLLGTVPWPEPDPTAAKGAKRTDNPRLREARKAREWTLAMFAEQVGVYPGTARSWEAEGATPRPATRLKVVEVLGFDPWEDER